MFATRLLVFGVLVALGLFGPAVNRSSAQSCDDFDECTINATCQPDGTCKGTAKQNGTSCDDGNPCTTNDSCVSGQCHGTLDPSANGHSCVSPLGDVLGACFLGATCQFGFCFPEIKSCPDVDGNKCTVDFCNPANGQCTAIARTCQDPCFSAQCDPGSGECSINKQPINNGGACDDGNTCTSNERCNNGECVGGGGTVGPTSTRTPTPTPSTGGGSATPTRTPTTGSVCDGDCGDCNGDGCVTLDEVMRAIRGALGQENVDACNLDLDGNGVIDIDEIIAARNAIGRPCGVTPTRTSAPVTATTTHGATTATPTNHAATATPTTTGLRTATPTSGEMRTASPTATTGSTGATTVSRSVGTIQSATSVLLVIPDVLSAVLGRVSPSSSLQRANVFTIPISCSGGGGGTLACDQNIVLGFPPTFSPPVYSVQLSSCKVSASTGATLTFNGTLTYTGNEGEVCGTVPENGTLAIPSLTIEEAASAGTVTASFSNFTAGVTLAGEVPTCHYSVIDLDVAGTITVTTKNTQGVQVSSTQAAFAPGTTLVITVQQYGSACVPEIYSMIVNGIVTFGGGATDFQGEFGDFTVSNDTTSGTNHVGIDGQVVSACFGGSVYFHPRSDLIIDAGAACPRAGEESVDHGSDFSVTDLIRYKASGLELDYGDNGTVDAMFNSCLDPQLFICPAS